MKLVLASMTIMLMFSHANAQTAKHIEAAQRDASDKKVYMDSCLSTILKGSPEKPKADATKVCEEGYAKAKATFQ